MKTPTDHIFFVGYPKELGGANTECWHMLKLFRAHGLGITMLPCREYSPEWRNRLDALGIATVDGCMQKDWEPANGLRGAIVLAMCNPLFMERAALFRELGCKIIYMPCMNWLFPPERLEYHINGSFDRYVFQSQYQHDKLVPQLRKWGYRDEQGVRIPGAFDHSEFPLRPKAHKQGERFIIGRLSRKGTDKYPGDLWQQYGKINHPCSARIMGWSPAAEDKCGPPRPGDQVLAECEQTAQQFLAGLHCMVPGIGAQAVENWPQVGLEALAAGVPIVAEARGGWVEMLDGVGALAEDVNRMAYEVARLAYSEPLRRRRIQKGRERLMELSNPEAIWGRWKALFAELAE